MQKIEKSLKRISDYIIETPVLRNANIDKIAGHNFFFKAESLQVTGAFKVRAVLNHLLILKEKNLLPDKVVCYSTGNHGIALSWASNLLKINARVYLPQNTAKRKKEIALQYGAEVISTNTRQEAEDSAKNSQNEGFYYLHPSDSEYSILGAATVCYEALKQMYDTSPDAIFASCGGGGLLSGTFIAKQTLAKKAKIFGCEPINANDAFLSIMQNSIYRFENSPDTIADGLRALSVSERTFKYLKQLDDFILVNDTDTVKWTHALMRELKIPIEYSCGISMAGAIKWLETQNEKKNVLVILSGGNVNI